MPEASVSLYEIGPARVNKTRSYVTPATIPLSVEEFLGQHALTGRIEWRSPYHTTLVVDRKRRLTFSFSSAARLSRTSVLRKLRLALAEGL
jgi:hypothetical protein